MTTMAPNSVASKLSAMRGWLIALLLLPIARYLQLI